MSCDDRSSLQLRAKAPIQRAEAAHHPGRSSVDQYAVQQQEAAERFGASAVMQGMRQDIRTLLLIQNLSCPSLYLS